jgi:hypothetical protein
MSKPKPKESLRDIGRRLSGEDKTGHQHVWERPEPVYQKLNGKLAKLGETGVPWNGPFECICGQSIWLTDGRPGKEDPVIRLAKYKAKLDAGEELTEEELADLKEIGEAMVQALNQFIEALAPFIKQVADFLADFWANLPEYLKDHLVQLRDIELDIEPIQTVDLVDPAGNILDTINITPPPLGVTQIVADHDQVGFVHETAHRAWPNLERR